MSRTSAMTTGFVLVFLGIQLFLVKSYVLSPRTTRFLAEHFTDAQPISDRLGSGANLRNVWPFSSQTGSQTSLAGVQSAMPVSAYGQKRVTSPRWLCWPLFFIGAVFFFHGIAIKKTT